MAASKAAGSLMPQILTCTPGVMAATAHGAAVLSAPVPEPPAAGPLVPPAGHADADRVRRATRRRRRAETRSPCRPAPPAIAAVPERNRSAKVRAEPAPCWTRRTTPEATGTG